ncbi:MAG: PQQ-binding-like beta-propeller repeat protein [Phycisphaerae bacterium]|nr:PQQ-binding-like beta-propeller repeat protein [Phycisphaerae bacterium]
MKFGRREFRATMIAALCFCAASAASAQRRVATAHRGGAASAGVSPLVKCDPDMTDWLARSRAAVKKKDYAEAIKILQALIDKPDAGFVPAGKEQRRFLPLRDEALRVLGEIPPEGLERYRRLYDPKAQRKLDDALAAGDPRGIKNVAKRYKYTRVGPKAEEAMGDWQFDHAQFAQAGRTWRALLAEADKTRVPLLLLKTAVAYHLAGQTEQAKTLAKELRTKYPQARATLAGREQNLPAALKAYLAIPCPSRPAATVLKTTYPGWGGLPTGLGVMPDTRAVLRPYWRYPAADNSADDPARGLQIRPDILGQVSDVELLGGRVSLRIRQGNRRLTLPLAPLIRPVVVGDLILYRDDERVVAVDAQTGQNDSDHGWQSQPLPMERTAKSSDERNARIMAIHSSHYARFPSLFLLDRGRYSLTVGGGRVYTVCRFAPQTIQYAHVAFGNTEKPPTEASSLAALSLHGQGKLEWIVGWSENASGGGDPFLRDCTFLSPPTYLSTADRENEGRLYTTVLYGEMFYLVCLDAATGRLQWKTQIAQTPVFKGAMYGLPALTWHSTPAAPPAVAEDRVFVTTNAGVTAAFDAHTSRALWAYQYGEATANPGSVPTPVITSSSIQPSAGTNSGGVSPVIVSDGVVITMPADDDEVLAFRADDGTLLWRRVRNRHLAALDGGRVCLAGEGVSILRASDGKELWRNGAMECFGDPAVTQKHLLLAGEGKLWRVRLSDYAVASEPLQADGWLGNLVSMGGKLIAASALGLCAYFDYDQTFAGLTERMKNAPSQTCIDLLTQRGDLSFHCDRYETALKDYVAAESLANTLPAGEEKRFRCARLRQRRYRTCIALGNREKDATKSLAWFDRARDLAQTNQERAHMQIRTARVLEHVGRFNEAVATAHVLGEQFPEEEVVDVRIGADVDPQRTFGSKDPTLPGRAWAYQFIHRLIQVHGQKVYAEFDAQALRALQQARRENTPEAYLSIQKRWPLSQYADEACFAAAEIFFYRACKTNDAARADEHLRHCEELLREVTCRQDSSHRPSALAALAAIYTAAGQLVPARHARIDLDELPADTPIAFADIRGPLEKVLRNMDEGKIKPGGAPSAQTTDTTPSYIRPPLRPIFTLSSPGAALLFDAEGTPLRLGQLLFVQAGDKTLLVDTSASNAEEAVRGVALTKIRRQPNQPLCAGLSRDGTIAAVANLQGLSVFRVDTCKLLRQTEWETLGCPNVGGVAVGEGLVIAWGRDNSVVAFDIVANKVRWEYASKSRPRKSESPPPNIIIGGPPGVVLQGGRMIRRSDLSEDHVVSAFTPVVVDDVVVVPECAAGLSAVVLDARNGKKLLSHTILPKLAPRRPAGAVDVKSLGAGLLAIVGGDAATVYDVRRTSRPVREQTISSPESAGELLGGNRYFLAVRGPDATVLLHPFRAPTQKTTTLRWNSSSGGPTIQPANAVFDEHRVYVFAAEAAAQGGSSTSTTRRLVVAAFDPVTGKLLWQEEPAAVGDAPSLYSFTQGENYLAVSLSRQDNAGGTCVLMDKATGKVVQHLPLADAAGKKPAAFSRRLAMTAGRLAMETGKGIAVYGE